MSLLRAMKSELSTISKHVINGVAYTLCKGEKEDDKNRATVIIMPGYGYFTSAFTGLSSNLEKENIRSKLWKYNFFGDLEKNAEEMTEILLNKYYRQGREINFIGHSLGCLIERDVLTRIPEPENWVRSAIFMAGPQKGTKAAWLNFFIPACRDMLPGSDYLTELNQRKLPKKVPITNIVSRMDYVILPWQNALLPEQENIENIILDDVGHVGMTERTDLILYGLNRQILTY